MTHHQVPLTNYQSAWTLAQLLEATQGELVSGPSRDRTASLTTPVSGISIDSRRLKPQEAFVAIRGARFDGHDFIPEAIERGAACLIVSGAGGTPAPIPTIRVSDTVRALGAFAAWHRRRFPIPVVAVTGSCGKTTTKELIAHLLHGGSDRVLKTQGTQNNQIGLPLTLLRLSSSHQVAVVELGSNHPGEIAYLAGIARPTVAVVTNIGPAHLEFFGSLEEVRREKLSLLEALGPDASAVIPGDQLEVLLEAKSRLHPHATLLTFGTSDQCGVQALEICRRD
jgi:UDP-N-acetylmuramoyl-tripeptide--D-alanyl-D-alanine ligase